MHLSNLRLWNFRKFGDNNTFSLQTPHLDLDFDRHLNVLIGENDSGKSAIVDAIRLVLKTHSYDWTRVVEDDFYCDQDRLRIEVTLSGMQPQEAKNFTELLCWEGEGKNISPYLRLILDVKRNPISGQVLPHEVRAGSDLEGRPLSPEAKEYLKLTYLKPLRNAEDELVARKNSRLSQILVGHDAFKGKGNDHSLIDLLSKFNKSIEKYFEGKSEDDRDIVDQKGKELKAKIDSYVEELYAKGKKTGLSVTERAQLKNLLEKLELSILGEIKPGLGTLNRLFMASELLHLNKENWSGLRLGLVEELEAHLHPQAQMQAIEALQKQKNVQLILTTHSPNIGSKVPLKNLIICNANNAFPMSADYTLLESGDYVFLQRFLDTTKANLFFSKGVILVEGWSEELLLPELAKLIGINLTEKGISVINVSSLAFIRYASIYKRKAQPYFSIPVAIVTDVDIAPDDEDGIKLGDKSKLLEKTQEQRSKYDGQTVKAFISPRWTLEYCLWKSDTFKEKFAEIVKEVHPKTDWSDFNTQLTRKLKDQGSLKKTEIAHRLAQAIAKNEIKTDGIEKDSHIGYLVGAIRHACGI